MVRNFSIPNAEFAEVFFQQFNGKPPVSGKWRRLVADM